MLYSGRILNYGLKLKLLYRTYLCPAVIAISQFYAYLYFFQIVFLIHSFYARPLLFLRLIYSMLFLFLLLLLLYTIKADTSSVDTIKFQKVHALLFVCAMHHVQLHLSSNTNFSQNIIIFWCTKIILL